MAVYNLPLTIYVVFAAMRSLLAPYHTVTSHRCCVCRGLPLGFYKTSCSSSSDYCTHFVLVSFNAYWNTLSDDVPYMSDRSHHAALYAQAEFFGATFVTSNITSSLSNSTWSQAQSNYLSWWQVICLYKITDFSWPSRHFSNQNKWTYWNFDKKCP